MASDALGTASAEQDQAVNVLDVSTTLTVTGPATVDAGAVSTLNVASSDPGQDTVTSWVVFTV